ncbi:integration host factor subunit beta [Candidatus Fermentibacteria bacterium]|nr:integration host factor subunit beta [Candidatus Fermentibacteria bacterium]
MTKADIVSNIADSTGLTKKEVATVVNQFFAQVKKALSDGEHIEVRGFGTFKVVKRNQRKARNPHTGAAVIVPQRKVPVFKPSRAVKEEVAR